MSTDSVLDAVIREYVDFHLEDVEEENPGSTYDNYCRPARLFRHWGNELLATYIYHNPNLTGIAQAKVQLMDRYFEWRASVPKNHLNRIGGNGHICLHQVFEEIFFTIRVAQLTIAPVQVIDPPQTPPPAPPPAILGITLGEVLGEA